MGDHYRIRRADQENGPGAVPIRVLVAGRIERLRGNAPAGTG
jgi:hypothetical protein